MICYARYNYMSFNIQLSALFATGSEVLCKRHLKTNGMDAL